MIINDHTTNYEKAQHSAMYMTDCDLLTGIVGERYREECQRLMSDVDGDLNELSRYTLAQIEAYLPKARALAVFSAMEISRRRVRLPEKEKPQVRASSDAYSYLLHLGDLPHEECWLLCLNRANRITKKVMISKGGVSGTVVDAKIVFQQAIEAKSAAIILAHNHPSGALRPSRQDCELTSKLVVAGKTLDLPLLDHLIIAKTGYYSFADEGQCK